MGSLSFRNKTLFILHHIVTKPKSGSKGFEKMIKLQDEKSFISKRKRPCVIRYFLKYDNEVEYYRALCILFLPFRNEKKDIHSRNVKDLYFAKQDIIERNRNKFEKSRTEDTTRTAYFSLL